MRSIGIRETPVACKVASRVARGNPVGAEFKDRFPHIAASQIIIWKWTRSLFESRSELKSPNIVTAQIVAYNREVPAGINYRGESRRCPPLTKRPVTAVPLRDLSREPEHGIPGADRGARD